MIKFLVAIFVASFLTGCENDSSDPEPGDQTPSSRFYIGATEEIVPLISEDCWDWFPVGDGLVWQVESPEGIETLAVFPIERVAGEQVLVTDLGWIAVGQYILVEDSPDVLVPIFKIQDVDLGKGALIAPVGDIEGSCNPVYSGAEAKAKAPPFVLAWFLLY